MKDLVIVGSGGLATEIKWLVDEINLKKNVWNVLGWISNDTIGKEIYGIPVLGGDAWLINHQKPIDVVVAIGDGKIRKKLVKQYKCNQNITFPSIIHESVIKSPEVRIGEGCIVMPQTSMTINISIGDFCVINPACTVGHDCVIKDCVTVFPGAHISGNVKLGECSSIGAGANIIQGKMIGAGAFIGAGATVINDIPEHKTAVGVPARILEKEDEQQDTYCS